MHGTNAFCVTDVRLWVIVEFLVFDQISFVADYSAHDVVANDFLQLLDPHFDFIERVFARDIVHKNSTL